MKSHCILSTRLVAGLWLMAVAAGAASASEQAGCARTELLRFTEDFRSVVGVDPATVDEARRALEAAPDEIIVPLHASLSPIQGWQQMPGVVAEVSRQIEAQQSARVQRAVDQAINGPNDSPEQLRGDLLMFVTMLRAFTPVAGAELTRHLDFVEQRVRIATPRELVQIRAILSEQVTAFRSNLQHLTTAGTAHGGGLRPVTTAAPCDSICSDDPFGICDAICNAVVSGFSAIRSGIESAINGLNSTIATLQNEVNGYVNQVVALTGQIQGFVNTVGSFVTSAIAAVDNLFSQIGTVLSGLGTTFSNLFNQIGTVLTGFFTELIALVPTTPEQAFNLLTGIQLTSTAWVDTLLARFPVLEAPCPEFGTDAGPLGIVGTLAAAQKSDGFAKLTKIFYEAAPSDVAGIKIKLATAAIYHPAEYWNLCARSRYAIAQHDLESAHRSHLAANLDVPLSTRGSLASGGVLSAAVTNVDQDVAFAAGKLDLLAPKSDELLRRLDARLSTRVKQTSVDDWRGTLRNIDQKVAAVESKLDVLQTNVRQEAANESDFQRGVAEFETLMTRLAIEDNLLPGNPNAVSLFQLPESFGGQLTLVRSIVEKTIAAMTAAGQTTYNAQRELERGSAMIPLGDFAGAFRQYRKAYGDAVKP